MEFRLKGINSLKTILKVQKNINILEKNIFILSKKQSLQKEEEEECLEDIYNDNIYNIIGYIIQGEKLNDLLKNIKKGNLTWNNPNFQIYNDRIKEQDDFIENPFEVEEGVLECNKCNSKRVYSYSKQVRSGDEGTTVYAQCVACKTKWTYNN